MSFVNNSLPFKSCTIFNKDEAIYLKICKLLKIHKSVVYKKIVKNFKNVHLKKECKKRTMFKFGLKREKIFECAFSF